MKVGIVLAVFGLFATEAVPPGIMDPLVRLGAVGVLGLVIVVGLWKTLPAITKSHSDAVVRLSEVLEGLQQQHHADQQILSKTLQELRSHCAKGGD